MKAVKAITKLLVVVGALNWGLVGFFQYDLVAEIFGGSSMMGARIVYCLIGLAGLYKLSCYFCCNNRGCGGGCGCGNPNCNCGHKR